MIKFISNWIKRKRQIKLAVLKSKKELLMQFTRSTESSYYGDQLISVIEEITELEEKLK